MNSVCNKVLLPFPILYPTNSKAHETKVNGESISDHQSRTGANVNTLEAFWNNIKKQKKDKFLKYIIPYFPSKMISDALIFRNLNLYS